MAHEELTNELIQQLKTFSMTHIATVAHARGIGSNIPSGKAILSREIKPMVEMGELKKEGTIYMLPHLTGVGTHALATTDAMVEILKRYADVTVKREHRITEVALQPDLMVLVRDGDKACCLIVEVMNKETELYFKQKQSTWKSWKNKNSYLTKLFGVEVKHFHLVTYGKNIKGVLTLENALIQMEN